MKSYHVLVSTNRVFLLLVSVLLPLRWVEGMHSDMFQVEEVAYFAYKISGGTYHVGAYDLKTDDWRAVHDVVELDPQQWLVDSTGIYYMTPSAIHRIGLEGGPSEVVYSADDLAEGGATFEFWGFALHGEQLYLAVRRLTDWEYATCVVNRSTGEVIDWLEFGGSWHLYYAPDKKYLNFRISLNHDGTFGSEIQTPLGTLNHVTNLYFFAYNAQTQCGLLDTGIIMTYPGFEYGGYAGENTTSACAFEDDFIVLMVPNNSWQPAELRLINKTGQLLHSIELSDLSLYGKSAHILLKDSTIYLFYRDNWSAEWPPYEVTTYELETLYGAPVFGEWKSCDPLDVAGPIVDAVNCDNGDLIVAATGQFSGETGIFRYSPVLKKVTAVYQTPGDGPFSLALDSNGILYLGEQDGRIWKYQSPDSPPEFLANTSPYIDDMAVVHGTILAVVAQMKLWTFDTDGVLLDWAQTTIQPGFMRVDPILGDIVTRESLHGRIHIAPDGTITTQPMAVANLKAVDPTLQLGLWISGMDLKISRLDDGTELASKAFTIPVTSIRAWTTEAIYFVGLDDFIYQLDPNTLEIQSKKRILPQFSEDFKFHGKLFQSNDQMLGWVQVAGPSGGSRVVPLTLEEMLGESPVIKDVFGGFLRANDLTWSSGFGYVDMGIAPWYHSSYLGWLHTMAENDQDNWFYWASKDSWFWTTSDLIPVSYHFGRGSWCYWVRDVDPTNWCFDYNMRYWNNGVFDPAPLFMAGRWMVADPDNQYGPSQLIKFDKDYFYYDTDAPELAPYLPVSIPYVYTRIDESTGYVDWTEGAWVANVFMSGYFIINFDSEKVGTIDSHIEMSANIPNAPAFLSQDGILEFEIVPFQGWGK